MGEASEIVDRDGAERLTVTIEHSGLVELADLTRSLGALSQQHARFAQRIGANVNGDDVRLYVQNIRQGSIIVELVAYAQQAAAFVETVKTIVPFAHDLVELVRFGIGQVSKPPPDATAKDARDVADFLRPATTDNGAHIYVEAHRDSTVVINQVINSTEANAATNRLNNFAAKQREPIAGRHEYQVFYFARATAEADRKSGDRGVIERFSRQPVRTIFTTPDAKQGPLSEALFRKVYVVDVEVNTVDDRPVLYKILHVHESMDRDDAA